jgi:tRNA-2-methylthio-N6-dimethylallyladenosine synthase
MNRLHREEYMTLIDKIRTIIPDGSISQDMITGFPTETEEDHQDTLSLMEYEIQLWIYVFLLKDLEL